jgi:hypothetical protein
MVALAGLRSEHDKGRPSARRRPSGLRPPAGALSPDGLASQGHRLRMSTASVILVLLGVLLIVPSSNLQRFDGLPLSSLVEFGALVLLIPFVASRSLRRFHRRSLYRAGRRVRGVLLGSALLALAAKLVLLASGVHEGFLACYTTPLSSPPSGPCERSWENPFFRDRVTRVDQFIDARPGTLNLSFVNSIRFSFRPPVGNPRRDRLPLDVAWHGEVERRDPWVARVSYVGQGTITIGASTQDLPVNYSALAAVRLAVPAGRHVVTVNYHFDDASRGGGPPPPGPYATFRLLREDTAGGEVLLGAARPAVGWRVLAGIADLLVALVFACSVGVLAQAARLAWFVLLPAAVIGILFGLGSFVPSWVFLATICVALWVLLIMLLASNRPRTRLALFFAVMALGLARAGVSVAGVDTVLYRSAGDDWLIYESFARSILETWSLRAGEDVFYFQPLFRYVRFGQRLVLGDGDLLVFAAGFGVLLFSVFWSFARLIPRRRLSAARTACILVLGLMLLTLVCSNTVALAVLAPLSEPVTWTALLFLFPLLVAGRSVAAWWTGAILAGLSIATRPNQASGTLPLVLVCLGWLAPRRPRATFVAAGLFLGFALLPLAHNLYYGGQWIFFTNARSIDVALARHSQGATFAWADIRLLLLLVPVPSLVMRLPSYGLLLAWLVAGAATLRARPRTSWSAVALIPLPALYLAVYLVFEVRDYFPRHLVVAYLAMGLVALHAAARGIRRDDPLEGRFGKTDVG